MKPHVCLFTDSLKPSGVGEQMLTLAEELTDRYDLSFVCPGGPASASVLATASELRLEVKALEVRGDPAADAELRDFLRRRGVDLLHCHAGVAWEGHVGVRAAHGAVPAILRTEHLVELPAIFATAELPDLVYSPYHLPDRRPGVEELRDMVARDRADYLDMVRLVDRVLCVSHGVRGTFLEVGVDPEKLSVVQNGIRPTPATSDRASTRERLGIPEDRPVVLTVGRMIDVKGHLFLLRAAVEVLRHKTDALFLWVGDGPQEPELRQRVKDAGVEDSLWFAGHRDDVPDLIAAADVVVLTSMVEGLPLVVLEAMAAGRPVVGTRVCGTSEVIRDGETGRLVDGGRLDGSGDADALAEAILQPLQDAELARRWGKAAKAVFERQFTSTRMAHETAAIYDELLARSSSP